MQSTHLREHNLSLLMRTLAAATEPLSRAGLAKATGLTKPTVSKLVEELLAARLVSEGAPVSVGSGRPMTPLRPAEGTVAGIGLEIRADQVSVLAIDLAGHVLLREDRRMRVTSGNVPDVLALCGDLVRAARAAAEEAVPVGVCLSVPGRMSPDGRAVLSAPNLDWFDVPLIEQLDSHPHVAGLPVQAQNDNRLSVRTELDRRPGESFVYVRGSTGVGGAVVLGGEVMDGLHGWAGEFGHTVVVPDGERCRCGRRGCLEAYVSHHALRERAGLGQDVLIEDLVEALASSSDRAEVIGSIGRALGIAVANALNILDLSTVVLSGYLAPIAAELSPVIRETVEAHALAVEAGPVEIERSDGVEHPALWGAARASLEPVLSSPGAWIRSLT